MSGNTTSKVIIILNRVHTTLNYAWKYCLINKSNVVTYSSQIRPVLDLNSKSFIAKTVAPWPGSILETYSQYLIIVLLACLLCKC